MARPLQFHAGEVIACTGNLDIMGGPEHEFAFGFVKFLLAQNLAQIDYADCLIDWVDCEMHPHFVAPLTLRGKALVGLIHEEEARLVARGAMRDDGKFRRFP